MNATVLLKNYIFYSSACCLFFCSEEPPPGCGSPHVDGFHHEHCRLPHEHTVSTRQMDRLVWNIHRHSIQWATAWNVILRSYWHFDYGPCYVENYPQLTSLYPACDLHVTCMWPSDSLLVLCAGFCYFLSMCVFLSISRSYFDMENPANFYQLSSGFGLCVASWVLAIVLAVMAFLSWRWQATRWFGGKYCKFLC